MQGRQASSVVRFSTFSCFKSVLYGTAAMDSQSLGPTPALSHASQPVARTSSEHHLVPTCLLSHQSQTYRQGMSSAFELGLVVSSSIKKCCSWASRDTGHAERPRHTCVLSSSAAAQCARPEVDLCAAYQTAREVEADCALRSSPFAVAVLSPGVGRQQQRDAKPRSLGTLKLTYTSHFDVLTESTVPMPAAMVQSW
jgi:hypothetical protein